VADFQSLVEGFEDAVEVAVSLALLGVPVDGVGMGVDWVTDGDRQKVVDIKEANANAGKQCRSACGRVAKGRSEGHASGGRSDAKRDPVAGTGADCPNLSDRPPGCGERCDDAGELVAGGFQKRTGELCSAEVQAEPDDGAASARIVVERSRSGQIGQHDHWRWLGG
jgi:hypothetical protein